MNATEKNDVYEAEHLGDGVYAKFDGWLIALSTERVDGTDIIFLGPRELNNLLKYLRKNGMLTEADYVENNQR